MNLKESIRKWVLNELPYNRSNTELVNYLNQKDPRELLLIYHNWMSRQIKPQPRRVLKSKAFLKNPLVAKRPEQFTQITNDIECGRDLRKYLSRGIEVIANVPTKSKSRRRDLDLMLNVQGIHHLHISTEIEYDGYVERGIKLLYAIFRPDTAYFIDIMEHGDWARKHVLEILASEWPDHGLIHEVKGSIGLCHDTTDAERKTLQEKHINYLVQIGDKVFTTAGKVMASGIALAASVAADRLLMDIEIFERDFDDNRERLKAAFLSCGFDFPEEPEFKFTIRSEGYGLLECKTRIFIHLG